MAHFKKILAAAAVLVASQQASAVPFEPTFSDYPFPGTQYDVDATANAFFSSTYGISIDNAYLYKDSRDTFDGIGVAVGKLANLYTPQVSKISFLDSTDFASIDYLTIYAATYTAYDSSNSVIESINVASGQTGTHLFSSSSLISYITFASTGGFATISGLRYDFDGKTDGHNDDIGVSVPEPTPLALLGLGLFALGLKRKKKA